MNHSKYCPALATTLSIFLVELKYRYGKSVHILRLFTNQAIFRCLHMSGTADQPDHVPSTERSNNRTAHFFLPLLVLWTFFAQCLAQTYQLRSIPFPSDGFARFKLLIINNISVLEGSWPSFPRTVVNIEIIVFEAMEPFTSCCFT